MTTRKAGTDQGADQSDLFGNVDVEQLPVRVKEAISPMEIARSHPGRTALMAMERITRANLATFIDNAEALVDFLNKAEELIIKRTRSEDWIIMGETPYALESAVKKALSVLGASITNIDIEETRVVESQDGRDFPVVYFTAFGDVIFNGRSVQAVGTSSTKDPFFAERWKPALNPDGSVKLDENKREIRVKVLLPLQEVEVQNVKKKSVTNLYKRGLDLIFKLNPTTEFLKSKGIEPKSFSYGKGSSGGSTDTAEEKDLRTKLKSLLAKVAAETGQSQAAILKSKTAFNNFQGYTEPDRVSSKMLKRTIDDLDAMLKSGGQDQGEGR